MSMITITELPRQNIRAQRARIGLTQADVAQRMKQLGYRWFPQTCGLVERNKRPLLADELAALALCLDTTPDALLLPPDVASVSVTFGDVQIPAQRLAVMDGSVSWEGNSLKVSAPAVQYRPGDVRKVMDAMREALASGGSVPQAGESGAEDIPVRRPGKRSGSR